jgi:predicted ATP-dependent serine protease
VLTMSEEGLEDVSNPSELFIRDSMLNEPQEGSAVVVILEGSRCLLAEVQCLASMNYMGLVQKSGSRRAADGFPIQRLLLISAVIEKRLSLSLRSHDLFLNIAGGLSISDPSADLAVAIAIVSSYLSINVRPATAFIGEIGLNGELRGGKRFEQRIQEAIKLGFRRIILPPTQKKLHSNDNDHGKSKISYSSSTTVTLGDGTDLVYCQNLKQAIEEGLMMDKSFDALLAERKLKARERRKRQQESEESLGRNDAFDEEEIASEGDEDILEADMVE